MCVLGVGVVGGGWGGGGGLGWGCNGILNILGNIEHTHRQLN